MLNSFSGGLMLDIYYFCLRSERSDFKAEPCKMKSILGCLVQLAEDPMHSDSFHLADPQSGKFDYLIVTTIL